MKTGSLFIVETNLCNDRKSTSIFETKCIT
jgi:hypothetical protein